MNSKTLLLVSLAVNIGLAFYVFQPVAGPEISQKDPIEVTPSTLKLVAATNTVFLRFNWRSVEAPEYREYMANLRAVGCPEETIHDIILADVNKLYDEKKEQVRKQAPKWEYWKPVHEFQQEAGRQMYVRMFALDQERDAVLRDLGIEPDFNFNVVWDAKKQALNEFSEIDLRLDFLQDGTKKAEIRRLWNGFLKEMDEIHLNPGLRSDLHLVRWRAEKKMNNAAKQLLTPEEAFQYDLRWETADSTRGRLTGIEPSEQEFVTVFKLRKAVDDEFAGADYRIPEVKAKYAAAEKQLLEQIKQSLGPERGADYELAQNSAFKTMYRITKGSALGTQKAKELYAMQNQGNEQAARIRTDENLTSEQRAAALHAIRQEAEKKIQTVLGENGLNQFNQGSRWLDLIQRP